MRPCRSLRVTAEGGGGAPTARQQHNPGVRIGVGPRGNTREIGREVTKVVTRDSVKQKARTPSAQSGDEHAAKERGASRFRNRQNILRNLHRDEIFTEY